MRVRWSVTRSLLVCHRDDVADRSCGCARAIAAPVERLLQTLAGQHFALLPRYAVPAWQEPGSYVTNGSNRGRRFASTEC
jgi:hypothetical protein